MFKRWAVPIVVTLIGATMGGAIVGLLAGILAALVWPSLTEWWHTRRNLQAVKRQKKFLEEYDVCAVAPADYEKFFLATLCETDPGKAFLMDRKTMRKAKLAYPTKAKTAADRKALWDQEEEHRRALGLPSQNARRDYKAEWPLEDGWAAHKRYATALRLWKPMADQGYALAQFNLGVMYANGQGVAKDEGLAVKWYRLAADQDNADAQFNLGFMYRTGQGVPTDETLAMKWLRLAADQGHAFAQFNLGAMYHNGRGVSQDYALAMKWLRLAADQGHASAQSGLGAMYADGEGVPKDDVLAYMWLNLGAAGGEGNAAKVRDIVAARMTPARLAEAQRLSREWKPK